MIREVKHQKKEIKSKYRFVILLLVWLISFVTSFQYVEYVNLPQSVLEYFQISHTEISWTITIMNAVFLTLIFAVIALLEKISLRNGIILCTSFILLGSCFKCLGMVKFFEAYYPGEFLCRSTKLNQASLSSIFLGANRWPRLRRCRKYPRHNYSSKSSCSLVL